MSDAEAIVRRLIDTLQSDYRSPICNHNIFDLMELLKYAVGSVLMRRRREFQVHPKGIKQELWVHCFQAPEGLYYPEDDGIRWEDFLAGMELPEELRQFAFEFIDQYPV